MPEFLANLPHSVAAFYYKAGADGFKQVEAAHAYVSFLDAYNLTEASVPLLKFNMNASGQMDGDAPQLTDMCAAPMPTRTRSLTLTRTRTLTLYP